MLTDENYDSEVMNGYKANLSSNSTDLSLSKIYSILSILTRSHTLPIAVCSITLLQFHHDAKLSGYRFFNQSKTFLVISTPENVDQNTFHFNQKMCLSESILTT